MLTESHLVWKLLPDGCISSGLAIVSGLTNHLNLWLTHDYWLDILWLSHILHVLYRLAWGLLILLNLIITLLAAVA